MTTGPVRASSEWLRLREPADAAARASELVEKVPWYLPTHAGAGTLQRDIGDAGTALSVTPRPTDLGPFRGVVFPNLFPNLATPRDGSTGLVVGCHAR
jgi:hypothetical protein